MVHELAFLWPWGDTNSNRWTTLLGGWPQTLEGVGAVAAGYALLRKHNCHVKGCPRLGRHPVDGTNFITCQKHHPHNHPPTHQEVIDAHRDHMTRLRAAEAHLARIDEATGAPPPGPHPTDR